MKKFYLVCLTLLSFGLSADLPVEKMSEIETRVGSMSLNELQWWPFDIQIQNQ